MNDKLTQQQRLDYLLARFKEDSRAYKDLPLPQDSEGKRKFLRALMNLRMPGPLPAEVLEVQDAYLKARAQEKGIVRAGAIPEIQPGLALWQGDITRLEVDAIVNAANSGMTGCYVPNHHCIDNAIHTYAGVQLRLDCAELMKKQGRPEPTGQAKITKAYNLPCRYVLHTVGPIIEGEVSSQDEELLASCYRSCLELAAENRLTSVAFCCISTGEFRFPKALAAEIAIKTVKEFLRKGTSVKKVIFNVYTDIDKAIYEQALR